MFFDEDLLEKSLKSAWRAGNNQNVETDIELNEICSSLETWFDNEDANPRKRMSLRTSAVLLNGVTKLYRDQTNRLLKDVLKLHENITSKKKEKRSFEEDEPQSSPKEEQNMPTGSEIEKPTGRKTYIISIGRKIMRLTHRETKKRTGRNSNIESTGRKSEKTICRESEKTGRESEKTTARESIKPTGREKSKLNEKHEEFRPKSPIFSVSKKKKKYDENCSQISNEY